MSASSDPDTDVNLTPLLDLVLQLIMFFMISISFVKMEQSSSEVALPVAQSGITKEPEDNAKFRNIFITLNASGDLVGLDKGFNLKTVGQIKANVQSKLDDMKATFKDLTPKEIVVVLRADKHARFRDVQKVLDACRLAGYVNWQIRVLTPEKRN